MTKTTTANQSTEISSKLGFPIVAVGASAGGLEAFTRLVAALEPGFKQAYVLVQHLDPDHESMLPELLARQTQAPVSSITDGDPIEAGRVYLVPSGAQLILSDGKLRLENFNDPRGFRRPIDRFFASVAKECGSLCVGVVLSGTGSDGSDGLIAIKERTGLVLVQDPTEAKYAGMPNSAVATNVPDIILPVAEMPTVIDEYFNRLSNIDERVQSDDDFVDRVTKYVRYRTGHDFALYKSATLHRRIARRMNLLGVVAPADYVQILISDPGEARRLLRDILINVTNFFRDPEVFETLRTKVIPQLLADKGTGDDVRIWVPGCSTGQEAFTIAMLIEDEIRRNGVRPQVSIFATDIDDEALSVAREAFYPQSIAAEVPRNYLNEYFTATADGYRVSMHIREMVRMSEHNVTADPPFARLDMISCRNLLIYLKAELQQSIFQTFHYSLKPEGFLILGTSETLGNFSERFDVINDAHRVFRRDTSRASLVSLPAFSRRQVRQTPSLRQNHAGEHQGSITDAAQRALLAAHTPPYVVVDAHGNILRASGRTSRFLELPEGDPNTDLRSMTKPGLRRALDRLVRKASETTANPVSHGFDGEIDGHRVRLVLSHHNIGDDTTMIVFQDQFDPRTDDDDEAATFVSTTEDSEYLAELEAKLQQAEQTIRTTVEELETSNEELQSSNEEMMSMNEELQSANEELSTINDELQHKVTELNEVNDDQTNLIETTQTAIVFLDKELKIRNFTAPATRFMRLLDHDRGRSIMDVGAVFDNEQLETAAKAVLTRGKTEEFEVQSKDGEADIRVQVHPYRSVQKTITGVAIAFDEVTDIRRYAQQMAEAEARAQQGIAEIEQIYRVSPSAMALMDRDMRYIRINDQLAAINGMPAADHIGKTVSEVVPDLGEDVIAPVRQVFETGEAIRAVEVIGTTNAAPGEERAWEVDWYPVRDGEDIYAVGVSVRDVTKYKAMEVELRRVMRELQHRVKNMLANVTALINRARREKGDSREVMTTLVKRIDALAKTHNLLTVENWGMLDLHSIIRPELIDVYGEDRVKIRGPRVPLQPKAALSLGMAIHEFATNAAKYGALSNDSGKVDVRWERTDRGDGEVLIMTWAEAGGPEVKKPERSGFGSDLIRATLGQALGGTLDLAFEPSGFRGVIEIPISRLSSEDDDNEEPSSL
ncbi:MAG: CheR family methyltransferase [Pseudomonadota bacterium]